MKLNSGRRACGQSNKVFTGSNQSPFFDLQVFTGSNPCLFHRFTGCLQCSGNIYREFTGWNKSGVWHLDFGVGVFAIYIVFTYFVRNIYVFFTVSSKILQKGILAVNFHLQRFQCNLHAIYML